MRHQLLDAERCQVLAPFAERLLPLLLLTVCDQLDPVTAKRQHLPLKR